MIIPEKNRREISKYLFQEGVCFAKKDYNLAKHPTIDVPNLQVIKLMQSFKSKEYVRETFAWMHYYWYLTNDGIEFLRTYLNLPSEIVPATLKKSAKPLGRPIGGPPGDRPRYNFMKRCWHNTYEEPVCLIHPNNQGNEASHLSYFSIKQPFLYRIKLNSAVTINRIILFESGPPRFEGDRPRFGDRDGYRAGPRGPLGEFGGEKGGAPADYQPAFRGGGGRPGFGRGAGGFGGAPPSSSFS
ncbi:small ribosomal subunit protein eS10z-like isoform X1 [Lycium barbarum]|uniref:small ribosomal subunit protein eS10z-like isoform X1 n=1 Tax=Lycium barbarum TaxID=112863 RepID=UPI00293EED61|nr:small ribosomal subunit protein eS10z-like isoform X1 [Lycium barbarum]